MIYVHKRGSKMYRKLEREALNRGASKFGISNKRDYKYFVIYDGKTIHFGHRKFSDYTHHNDDKRRANYRARHQVILKKDGKPAYLDKNQASYWSYWLLWD
jgi:hypothetical protein